MLIPIAGLSGSAVSFRASSFGEHRMKIGEVTVRIHHSRLPVLLIVALALASVAPSTPGYVGIFQFVAVSVLAPFAVTQSEALALILLFQGVVYAVVTPFGLVGLARLGGGNLSKSLSEAREPE